jgi:hypothetical protein
MAPYTRCMQRKTVALQVRLPDDLHAEIRRLTEEEDRPLNRTIVRLLRAGLEHYYVKYPELREESAGRDD